MATTSPSLKDLEAAAKRASDPDGSILAVLGPTNTGKTFFALERLLAHKSGMIGLPLRLLAREVFDKLVVRTGARDVALVTGEEKIVPPNPRYWVSTVEAMPLEQKVDCLAIDEIQLASDAERGRIFTSRLLHARGQVETIFIGSDTMRPILKKQFPNIEFFAKERFSQLTHAGQKKVSRLPRRSAIVAFSVDNVYAIAELIRRQNGGAAVVLGALSPRTRNAQAALYQEGEVDYLVATDAIGMGLNLDIDHVAFAAKRKFDGRHVRDLRADELAQIAGRAGRHVKDGTFGVTGDCNAFDDDIVEAIEEHQFAPVEALQWRSETLDFSSLSALRRSLDKPPTNDLLRRCRAAEDETVFQRLHGEDKIRDRSTGVAAVALLWDVCQIPDFRKSPIDEHARMLSDVFERLIDHGRLDDAFLAPRIDPLDRLDGEIDAISTRISFIRTWTYIANRAGWLDRAPYWQDRTRSIEDALSDVLHQKLTQRFVDRRTSVLMRKLRDDGPLLAGVNDDGEVFVEGQFVGRLIGFEFLIDPRAKGVEAKRVRHAADRALAPLLASKAAALANAEPDDLTLMADGVIWWRSGPVARLEKGPQPLRPEVHLLHLETITPSLRGRVFDRLKDFVAAKIEANLADLIRLKQAVDAPTSNDDEGALSGMARGIAFRLAENFGAMSRSPISGELKQLDQTERGKLRKLGVRFGEVTLHMPHLLKPAPSALSATLWALWAGKSPHEFTPPKAGLVSTPIDTNIPHAFYYATGYRPSGTRAVRIDMLERLAGLIRSARNTPEGREGFEGTQQMMSLVGCSGEDFESILQSLGYRKTTVNRKKPVAVEGVDGASRDDDKSTEESKADSAETKDVDSAAASAVENQSAEASDGDPATASSSPSDSDGADAEQTEPETAAPSVSEASEAISGVEPSSGDTAANNTTDPQSNADEAGGSSAEISAENDNTPRTEDGSADAASEAIAQTDTEETIEVVVWKPAPRRADTNRHKRQGDRKAGQHKQKGGGKNATSTDNKTAGDRPPRKGPGKGKRPPSKHAKNTPRQYSSGPKKGAGADPNSPFAVLAALKGDNASGDKS